MSSSLRLSKTSASTNVLPNFLLVGGAKCGTTSLHNYLAQHPEVFMPEMKEPKFFSSHFIKLPECGPGDDRIGRYMVKDFDAYQQLFRNAGGKKARGESTTDNLYYYERTIPLIKQYLGDVKVIIIIRNPADRAFSAYLYKTRDMRETLPFEDALRQEDDRKRQNWDATWHYTSLGFYSRPVEGYLHSFRNVKIVLFDDLCNDAATVMKNLFLFLDVDDSFQPDLSHQWNVSGAPKNRIIQRILFKPGGIRRLIHIALVKSFMSESTFWRFVDRARRFNLKKVDMLPETRAALQNLFREDILKTQDLIKQDLSAWLE